ncbi:helix-turn-helix transcriptional regulator [Nocardiopsis chromatogenes]|uniref:helix-turn-helix transcriptional regulator n=1 Tax=Nocardiopsis chromatogenes TaxID=280239 RepID=UPI00034808E9|nr:helix-turn-helix transcriptional regulator [Nocardiopsis chromatogenes]
MPSHNDTDDRSPAGLDRRAELSEFLRSRRARLKPADVGLPDYGSRRRVPGLRREELAQAAGVSVSYYTHLEQGHSANVSEEVLDAITRVLQLTETEHAHLTHLVKPERTGARAPSSRPQRLRPDILQLLDAMTGVPAYVNGFGMDILGWNRAATALFGDWAELAPEQRNWGRLIFLTPAMRDLFIDWERKAGGVAGILRMQAGRHPGEPRLASLVDELSAGSEDFRRLWAVHEVRRKGHGVMRLNHPQAGELAVSFETFPLLDDPDQMLVTYHAEPGSESAAALRGIIARASGADRTDGTERPGPDATGPVSVPLGGGVTRT